MSEKIISLDLSPRENETLDVGSFFPMEEARASQTRGGIAVDHIDRASDTDPLYREIDLSYQRPIEIDSLETGAMLDLASREVIRDSGLWSSAGSTLPPPRIDLMEPLTVPYGAIDIRPLQPSKSDKKYADLFERRLPYELLVRRQIKQTKTLWTEHKKKIFSAIAILALVSVPLLAYVGYAVSHGYDTLKRLPSLHSSREIRDTIRTARGDFERAGFLLTPFSWIPVTYMDSVRRATDGGLALTRGLDAIAQTLSTTTATGVISTQSQDPLSYRAPSRDMSLLEPWGISQPTDWIVEHRSALETASREFARAGSLYAGVQPTGARTLQMQDAGQVLSRLAPLLRWSLDNQDQLLKILGHINPQRYIVFNQNRDEIRANGGFPGSIITFTLYKGNILDYRTDDVYYYDWNLYPYKEIPPPGIALMTDTYGLRDVNYYPDFRETLDKANSFIERSGDASITSGIAIHQGLIENILEKTGPISVSGVTLPFDSKNFSLLMSTLVENKYAKENTPKDILFRFVDALGKKIIEKKDVAVVLDSLEQAWRDGEILFASRDDDINTWMQAYKKPLPWNTTSRNWVYPVWTSVSGNKSDRYIDRTYRMTVTPRENCTYENTLTLESKHRYAQEDRLILESYFGRFGITDPAEQTKLRFIQGDGKNRSFVRVFTPASSELVSSGSDITVTSLETARVYAFMLETPVGATTTKTIRYNLPIADCATYTGSVDWYRQPGLQSLHTTP